MAQIFIAPDLYLRLQEYARQQQRSVDEVAQEILSAGIKPPPPPTAYSIAEALQALDQLSGSLELEDSEERIRNHDRYFAGLEDEGAL